MNGVDNQQRNDEGLRELALFAGAGGGILGGHLLGWRTVCAVEYNAYARSVLLARQNDGTLAPFPVWDDVCTFDGKPWRGLVDVVSGGFPCQDISAAGKGAGLDGARSGLWCEMARIIREVRPRYVFVENSPMLTSRGLGVVLGDLAAMGFDAEWGVISAADTDAPHLRERIWIVANAQCVSNFQQRSSDMLGGWTGEAEQIGLGSCGENVGDSNGEHGQESQRESLYECDENNGAGIFPISSRTSGSTQLADAVREREQRIVPGSADTQDGEESSKRQNRPRGYGFGRWPTEPGMGRVANGMAYRADRLKAIGNGQVSRVAATAWRILSQ